MGLADKMWNRSNSECPLRSDCTRKSNQRFFDSLFEGDWEVFVIKHDSSRKEFNWFTSCCESALERVNQ